MTQAKPANLDGFIRELEFAASYSGHAERVRNPKDLSDRFGALRAFYEIVTPRILHAPKDTWAIDPYACDWPAIFTPIEYQLWCAIRMEGVVLYPQYPVGLYFVDFGHPAARVAIECDGARWHQDLERDAAREREIGNLGWSVHRITGRDCLQVPKVELDAEGQDVSELPEAQRFVREIAMAYGLCRRYRDGRGE